MILYYIVKSFSTAITCPILSSPSNGRVTVSRFPIIIDTIAGYVCDEGYVISGNSIRLCGGGDGSSTTGVWSGTAATCTGTCIYIYIYVYMHRLQLFEMAIRDEIPLTDNHTL